MYDNVRESSRVYDEIGDPVEMSTVYTLISPNGVGPTDEYSLATGTCAQNQTEDGEVSYSQVKVPEGEASVPSANTDKVVYSEARVEDSSPSLAGDASPPLYSESLGSSSERFTPSSSSSSSTGTNKQPETESAAGPDKLLYVSLVLVVLIIGLSVALLMFCRRRPRKLREGPAETSYDSVRKASRVYEEIREDRQSRCPPVEVSTVYTCAKFSKSNGVETTDEYSSITAHCPQNKPEHNPSKVIYAAVDFHKSPASPPDRPPSDQVIYSVPLTSRSKDSEPPLYATVALH
ncbi:hypothetical protein Q5P01_008232 [Channa striata]|uniref:Uncharacterized protein n=1 Tax=Channa striata TaxID=64152 RepID=A0AA88NDN8_CHASR|nr:hypothetical protein Q5P01_008232 [Channa striata]